MTTETTEPAHAGHSEAETFYAEVLQKLTQSGIPFLVSGTYAVNAYTGMQRPTKDMDLFCKPGDFPRILSLFQEAGYAVEIEDERWLAKVRKGTHFFDIIFNSTAGVMQITDDWFKERHSAEILGMEVRLVPPTEMIWSKAFVQNRERYDGADVLHMILRRNADVDWERLLRYMDQYWEVLLVHILNFRFVYPTERDCIPRWLFDELMGRLRTQAGLPPPQIRVCRGRLLAPHDYLIDVREWGFADMIGK